MKILSKLVCATVFLSPLLLTGCDAMSGLFGDSSQYNNPQPYGYPDARRAAPGQATVQTPAAPTSKAMTPYRMKKVPTTGVPVEPPSAVQTPRHSASVKGQGMSNNSTAGKSASTGSSTSNAVVVPPPVAPATGMVAPTAQ